MFRSLPFPVRPPQSTIYPAPRYKEKRGPCVDLVTIASPDHVDLAISVHPRMSSKQKIVDPLSYRTHLLESKGSKLAIMERRITAS